MSVEFYKVIKSGFGTARIGSLRIATHPPAFDEGGWAEFCALIVESDRHGQHAAASLMIAPAVVTTPKMRKQLADALVAAGALAKITRFAVLTELDEIGRLAKTTYWAAQQADQPRTRTYRLRDYTHALEFLNEAVAFDVIAARACVQRIVIEAGHSPKLLQPAGG